ncbi:MAG TPA: ABC transporter permease [Terriglobales bacterium]|nr:ABC transporter permease [Terriglobales bacterium]
MEIVLLESLLQSTVIMAVPLLLAGLGELISERAGVLNIGLEGMMLAGAFAAMAMTHASGSPLLGWLAASSAGVTLALVFGLAIIPFGANQVVAGVALNLFAVGLTGVLYRGLFGITGAALTVAALPVYSVPGLRQLPLFGPALFEQTWLGYFAFAAVGLVWFGLQRTLPGLKLKMVGENPRAAAAQGVRAQLVQWIATGLCGWFAATAGAFLVIAYTRTFVEGISAGRGFIALGIVIFGQWSPIGVLGAALLFGFATALQFHVQAQWPAVPYQVMLVLPYVLTLLVLVVAKRQAQAPAALGAPLREQLG